MRTLWVGVLVAGVLLTGCEKKGLEPGSERGPCYGNKTCNAGLVCRSELCVKPFADNPKVEREHLGNILVRQFDELADRACECKDAACAKGIGEDMMTILEGVDKNDEPSKAGQERIMDAMERIQKCTTKLTMPGAVNGN